jgi:hypothetical protein
MGLLNRGFCARFGPFNLSRQIAASLKALILAPKTTELREISREFFCNTFLIQ